MMLWATWILEGNGKAAGRRPLRPHRESAAGLHLVGTWTSGTLDAVMAEGNE